MPALQFLPAMRPVSSSPLSPRVRRYRSRAQANRTEKRVAAFTPVRGVYREETEKEPLPQNVQAIGGTTFSREQLTHSVILPEKVLTRPIASGTLPKPFIFALTAGTPPPPSTDGSPRSSWVRYSNASSLSNRFSVISSSSSVDSTPTAGAPRKIRQLFNPVLPDELLITGLGERLTVVQAFDDGWVVVGRSTGGFAATAKSMFNDIELGVVPAWCFLKPVKGLRAERPVRSTSLGITILSWSNF
ncbi:hypothetical protein B0H17DRAFT_1156314 [Mycena rosella]|uniref:SH3 domain-containing protein n=1 Tax=Mycena rosella TaxID=1033263 RepID=A0AAD7GY34_MYCRO|nr:hypothetical protein B0H17DRAFT_1156314 [Mycena rosella]